MRSETLVSSSSSHEIMQHLQGTAASVARHVLQSNVIIGLDQIDEYVITKNLEPMRSELLDMDVETLLTLDRVDDGAVLRPGVHVRPIHLDILPSLSDEESESIRYIHIDEIPEQYSLGIFVFPPFARIPLHDHPNMVVLSRVLYGDVTVRSYDIIHPSKGHVSDPEKADMNKESTIPSKNDNPTEKHWYANILPAMKEMFSTHVNKAMQESHTSISTSSEDKAHQHNPAPLRVQENAPYSLAAPQVSTLFPHSGNVHEFTAGKNGAAILDFILPPYDTDHDRDCTFYVEKEMTVPGETKRDEMDVEQKQCWLLPIPSPSDFHCVTGHYRYLGKSVDIE